MKKHLAILLALSLLLGLGSALAAENAVINKEFNREEMLNIHGETVKIDNLDNLIGDIEMGFAYMAPDVLSPFNRGGPYPIDFGTNYIRYEYLPKSVIELYRGLENIQTEEEYNKVRDQLLAASVDAFSVYVLSPERENSDMAERLHKEAFQHIEPLATNGKDQYFLAYNLEFEGSQLTDEEKVEVKKFIEETVQIIKSGLILFPSQDYFELFGYETEPVELPGGVEALVTTDLNGNPFGPEDFAKYDLTVVNIWYTGCGACIAEMPHLQKLKEALPENVNLITVCLDAQEEMELVQAITEGVNATFTTLVGDTLKDGVLKNINSTPTNLFLDSNGMQVGDAIMGATGGNNMFVEQSMEIIAERLAMIGK